MAEPWESVFYRARKGTMLREWAILYVRCRQLGRAIVKELRSWMR